MPPRVQQAQGNQAGQTNQTGGAIGQAAQQTRANQQQQPQAGIVSVSKYWSDKTPDIEEALKQTGMGVLSLNRDRTTNIGTKEKPFASEVDPYGNPKLTPEGGLSQQYTSSISKLYDRLEEAGVGANEANVRTVLKEWFKPENRMANLGANSIFNDKSWHYIGNNYMGGSKTYEDDVIDKLASHYAQTRKARDAEYNTAGGQVQVGPPAASKTITSIQSQDVSPAVENALKSGGARIRVVTRQDKK